MHTITDSMGSKFLSVFDIMILLINIDYTFEPINIENKILFEFVKSKWQYVITWSCDASLFSKFMWKILSSEAWHDCKSTNQTNIRR